MALVKRASTYSFKKILGRVKKILSKKLLFSNLAKVNNKANSSADALRISFNVKNRVKIGNLYKSEKST